MDFDELLAQADSNAKKNSKKLMQANREMESEKRKNMERLAIQKKLEKEQLKRKLPPKSIPEKPKFVIPKKNNQEKSSVDKNKLSAFLDRQEREKQENMLKKQREKEELIKLRIEAYGGKANKKISKHFGKSPIELQMRYAHNPEHEETLRRQAEREQEEHEKLSDLYRQGVYKALNKKDDVVASHNRSKVKLQQPKLAVKQSYVNPEGSSLSKTLSSNLAKTSHKTSTSRSSASNNASLEAKKRRSAATVDFNALMQTANKNCNVDPDSLEFAISEPKPVVSKKPKPSTDGVGVTAGLNLTYASKRAAQETNCGALPTERTHKVLRKTNNSDDYDAKQALLNKAKSFKNDSLKSTSQSKEVLRTSPSKATSKVASERTFVDPESGPIREKRYLPGDIRAQQSSKSVMPLQQAPQKRYLPGDIRVKQDNGNARLARPNQHSLTSTNSSKQAYSDEQRRYSTPSSFSKSSKTNEMFSSRQPSASSLRATAMDDYENQKTELEKRRRELIEMERAFERKQQMAASQRNESSKKMKQPEQQTRNNINNSRQSNSRMERMRSRSPAIRYDNYTDSDEDDEDAEEDEYDSDMADFIDDTAEDELQREDFEESLRLINPRYNKKKWLMREKMIDDRRMDARFRDIETEERASARLGFCEDLAEARRGSKALH